jgi:predicted HicB family RNase H-like nuclease
MNETIQFSIRIRLDTYRRLKFIAADQDETLNKVVSRYLEEATAKAHVSVPTGLGERSAHQ